MKTKGYNGWPNWATWATVLWARNDEANYEWWVNAGRQHKNTNLDTLAETLQRTMPIKMRNPDLNENDWHEVDWHEVANAMQLEGEDDY